ncbi:hypothetical protein BC936DRAFT_145111 [Jimgerdemannia flammicorona]|uniref:Uncharacterized protein n=2 Tax=Jimgerdemannia flammicorona TaxID=994334 RepID=A0A433DAX2_9FUNG|nr:hypothetical protein BC936DRAFT_145111 [Jimgerdemannia flammicorona]RUS24613.1 hypothetical protein BC938DRAFT_473321 [Jimgerdemannia flammicorona]
MTSACGNGQVIINIHTIIIAHKAFSQPNPPPPPPPPNPTSSMTSSAPTLDMALDDIISSKKSQRPRRGGQAGGNAPRRGGGVQKRSSAGPVRHSPRTNAGQLRSSPYGASQQRGIVSSAANTGSGEGSKILVSNLDYNVTEADLRTRPQTIFKAASLSAVLHDPRIYTPAAFPPRRLAKLNGTTLHHSIHTSSSLLPLSPGRHLPSHLPSDDLAKTIRSRLPSAQELFETGIGPLRKVQLNYDQNGKSKGQATIIFQRARDGAAAFDKFHNVTLDNRPMKIEILLNPSTALLAPAPVIVPAFVNAASPAGRAGGNARGGSGSRGGRGGSSRSRGGRGGRGGKKEQRPHKTQDELDAEMAEYMNVDSGAAPTGTDAMAD